jgi:hypothetical protein
MPSAATTRRIALALAAAALLAGCGEAGPKRDAAGAIAQAGDALLVKLRVGDCVGNLRDRLDHPDGANNGVPKVTAVKCAAKHDAELVKIARIGTGEWPGFEIVDGEAARGRQQLAVRLVRARETGGRVQVVSFRPTKQRWEFENQHAVYYLVLYAEARRGTLPK